MDMKSFSNKTTDDNSKRETARVVNLVCHTLPRPDLHFYQVSSKIFQRVSKIQSGQEVLRRRRRQRDPSQKQYVPSTFGSVRHKYPFNWSMELSQGPSPVLSIILLRRMVIPPTLKSCIKLSSNTSKTCPLLKSHCIMPEWNCLNGVCNLW